MGSAFYFLYAVMAVVTGALGSKVSIQWIIFVMGLTWALVQFPMLFAGGAAILLLSRIFLGRAEGPATPISLAAVHSWFPASRRALPSMVWRSARSWGGDRGPLVGAGHRELRWRWAFGVLGIFDLFGFHMAGSGQRRPLRTERQQAEAETTNTDPWLGNS